VAVDLVILGDKGGTNSDVSSTLEIDLLA